MEVSVRQRSETGLNTEKRISSCYEGDSKEYNYNYQNVGWANQKWRKRTVYWKGREKQSFYHSKKDIIFSFHFLRCSLGREKWDKVCNSMLLLYIKELKPVFFYIYLGLCAFQAWCLKNNTNCIALYYFWRTPGDFLVWYMIYFWKLFWRRPSEN